jgi:DNA-binding transcriptional MerR regulator
MATTRSMLRIGGLAKATGVSVQTIHYYLREGLLAPPTKTAPNMAYYGPEYIEDIRLIKELQERRYLPLSLIRLVLQAKRQGQDVSHLEEMRLGIEEIFRPLTEEEEMKPVDLVEFVILTGLDTSTLRTLEDMGLVMPVATAQGKAYDGLDVSIARAGKALLDLGIAPADLSYYGQYVELIRTEARVIHDAIHRLHDANRRTTELGEVKSALDTIKSSLSAKVYRKVVTELHLENEAEG